MLVDGTGSGICLEGSSACRGSCARRWSCARRRTRAIPVFIGLCYMLSYVIVCIGGDALLVGRCAILDMRMSGEGPKGACTTCLWLRR